VEVEVVVPLSLLSEVHGVVGLLDQREEAEKLQVELVVELVDGRCVLDLALPAVVQEQSAEPPLCKVILVRYLRLGKVRY